MRTENGQGSAARFQSLSAHVFGCWRAHLTKGNLANMGVRCRGNAFYWNSLINDFVVIADNLRDRHRTVVNPYHVLAMHRVARQVEIAKTPCRNKGEATRSDWEIEIESDRVTPVSETKARPETSRRRQGRPAAIVIRISPGYPGRRPNTVRLPAPTQMSMTEPTAIVERRPAPRIIRQPVPAAI